MRDRNFLHVAVGATVEKTREHTMELRDIEILLTLAEELHFGRTATRLHLSQARISQSVKSQERRIGAPLVDRVNPRAVGLTPLGIQLVTELRPAYHRIVRTIDHARLTAHGVTGVLRIGFQPGAEYEHSPAVIADFTRRNPAWQVMLRQVGFADPIAALEAGEADVVFARAPFERQQHYRVTVVATEPRWVILPVGHRLSTAPSVPFTELLDEAFVALSRETGCARAFWLAEADRGRAPVRVATEVNGIGELVAAVAHGAGIGLTAESTRLFHRDPGVVFRPVDGIGPCELVVVSRPADDRPVVADFLGACAGVNAMEITI
ncbi:LysR family transcriptional regulator [Nocardia sp. NPDC058666]|uniref:LysR family transcriptional regulator n=1 Tax=Nocardia sp. NPDC058666 TaxID=3346587 RepID=UPI00365759E3